MWVYQLAAAVFTGVCDNQTGLLSSGTMGAPRYDIAGQGRFLTFSCYRRLRLLGDARTRDAFAAHLELQRVRLGFRVIAWVAMPEHVHLIVLPREGAIGPVLRGIKQGFGRTMIERWRSRDAGVLGRMVDGDGITRFWQRGGGYDRNLRDRAEVREKIGYIHQNPVRRGMVERAEDWRWSSAGDCLGVPGTVEVWRGWDG